jgi:hypothetical protein
MKFLLSLLVISLMSSPAWSAEGKKTAASPTKSTNSKVIPDQNKGTLDITPSGKEDVTEDTALVMKPEDVKADVTCKAHNGHELKHGDKGYKDCLKNVKKDKNNKDAEIKVDFKK